MLASSLSALRGLCMLSHSVLSNSLQPHGLWPARLSPWDSPGKNPGAGCHFLLQGIFPTQGLNPGLLHCRQILYCLNHYGSPPERSKLSTNKGKPFKWILQGSTARYKKPKAFPSSVLPCNLSFPSQLNFSGIVYNHYYTLTSYFIFFFYPCDRQNNRPLEIFMPKPLDSMAEGIL